MIEDKKQHSLCNIKDGENTLSLLLSLLSKESAEMLFEKYNLKENEIFSIKPLSFSPLPSSEKLAIVKCYLKRGEEYRLLVFNTTDECWMQANTSLALYLFSPNCDITIETKHSYLLYELCQTLGEKIKHISYNKYSNTITLSCNGKGYVTETLSVSACCFKDRTFDTLKNNLDYSVKQILEQRIIFEELECVLDENI